MAFDTPLQPQISASSDAADLIVLIGSNTAWCHPVVYQRIQAARAARGTKLVVIDPRRTETAEQADLHLALRPGSDVALMNGLLAFCRRERLLDEAFLAAHVHTPDGFWEALDEDGDLWSVARTCDVPAADMHAFCELFAAWPRTVTMSSQGVSQSLTGTDQVNAIINLHLATGRVGKPGAAPFSITGQPNAMGGREVGGLASTLAAHMDFAPDNVARVGRFWAAPAMAAKPGLKAVDLFRQVGAGRIKALWIMATNPAVSMPDAGRVREALAACPFVVVSDVIAETDTTAYAHVRLPAAAWGETDGTATNSERRVSRQRAIRRVSRQHAILPLPGEARPDWWIVKEVARRMGWATAFAYSSPADIFREHARLSAYQNGGTRLFDLAGKVAIGKPDYDAMAPFIWGRTPFADGCFATPDRRARLVPVRQAKLPPPLPRWPLTLNTGRYRDHWHTMTRTGLSPKIARHREEPLVELHPRDAATWRIGDGNLARVSKPQGESVFRARISEAQRPGELFTPIHWTDRTSTGGRTGLLPRPLADPHSGQPAFKATPARIEPIAVAWHGFLLLADERRRPQCLWATRVAVPAGVLIELAGEGDPAALDAALPRGEWLEAVDAARGTRRVVVIVRGRLAAALFVARDRAALPAREWLIGQLDQVLAGPVILAGRAPGLAVDHGPIVCASFEVGLRTIAAAIADRHLTDVAAIGQAPGRHQLRLLPPRPRAHSRRHASGGDRPCLLNSPAARYGWSVPAPATRICSRARRKR